LAHLWRIKDLTLVYVGYSNVWASGVELAYTAYSLIHSSSD